MCLMHVDAEASGVLQDLGNDWRNVYGGPRSVPLAGVRYPQGRPITPHK